MVGALLLSTLLSAPIAQAQAQCTTTEHIYWSLPGRTEDLTLNAEPGMLEADVQRMAELAETKPEEVQEYHCHVRQPASNVLKTMRDFYGIAPLLPECMPEERVEAFVNKMRMDPVFDAQYSQSERLTNFLAGVPSVEDLDAMETFAAEMRRHSERTRTSSHLLNLVGQIEIVRYSQKSKTTGDFSEWLAEYNDTLVDYICAHGNYPGSICRDATRVKTPPDIDELRRTLTEKTHFRIEKLDPTPYK